MSSQPCLSALVYMFSEVPIEVAMYLSYIAEDIVSKNKFKQAEMAYSHDLDWIDWIDYHRLSWNIMDYHRLVGLLGIAGDG